SLDRDRCCISRGTLRIEALGPGIPETKEYSVESGWPSPLQPRGEPERRGCALCVSGNIHDTALRACESPARSPRWSADRICGCGKQIAVAFAACTGSARGGGLRVAQEYDRHRRSLSPAEVDRRRSF